MKCPYCGEEMDVYEKYDVFKDDDTIESEEHWECRECDRTFARDVIYKAIKKGDLCE